MLSKLTKLFKHPILFFKDAYMNKINCTHKTKETVIKKATQEKKQVKDLILRYVNASKPIYHLIHTGEGLDAGISHLSMWIPIFLNSGENFVVLLRKMDIYELFVKKYSNVNAVYAKKPINVEEVLDGLTFLRGIYYLSNTGNLIHTLKFYKYRHIFLGHGDSDKSSSIGKFFRVYDEIWVAGQGHIDRFKNAGVDTRHITFVKVGRPLLIEVLKSTKVDWIKRIKTIKVLYMPTWEGFTEESNYSSAKLSISILSNIYKRFNVHITAKYHPLTSFRDTSLKSLTTNVVLELNSIGADFNVADKTVPIPELLLKTNIYICDISAVVSECIAANSPIFIYIPKDKKVNILQSEMKYKDYAYTFSSAEELCEKFEDVISGNDYLDKARKKASKYLISKKKTLDNNFFKQLCRISSIEN
jgi:hypothetical protein